MTATIQSPTPSHDFSASMEADPFLIDLPEKDYIKISLDETPLPIPDELPPECDYDDFECIETRSAIIEQLTAQKAAQTAAQKAAQTAAQTAANNADPSPSTDRGSAMAGATNPDLPPVVLLTQKTKPKRGAGQSGQSFSPGRAMRDACFQSVMFFPRKIFLMGHWAHDLKLGGMSGRKVIGVLSVVCAILLVVLMFAALWRSNSLRGIM